MVVVLLVYGCCIVATKHLRMWSFVFVSDICNNIRGHPFIKTGLFICYVTLFLYLCDSYDKHTCMNLFYLQLYK